MELLILVLLAVLGVAYILLYNRLIGLRERVRESWSGVTVQLKRRHDLVPNLVSAVQGAMAHERAIVDEIVEARRAAVAASERGDANATGSAEARLTGALRGLFALAESNPQIAATANVSELQSQVEETEDQIAAARRLYNGNVQTYNATAQSVPSNIVAGVHGFSQEPMFTLPEAERRAVEAVPQVAL